MAGFNVLEKPWIPVVDKNGKTEELGILGVLERAPDLMEISEPSPLMRYGIYRLLIAFLTDALRPETEEDLADIMNAGRFPLDPISEYIAECEKDGKCFDLFDPDRPFLQSAYKSTWDDGKKTSIAKLLHELPSGNNAIHFEHAFQDEHALGPPACTRALAAVNVFCTSGLQGPSSINGAPPWFLLLRGKNLFQTLVYSLWLPSSEIPFAEPPIAWRNPLPVKPKEEVTLTSYLYGLTWQSRRALLIPEEGGICTYTGKRVENLVREVYFQAGWKFAGHDRWHDPHVTYIYKKDTRSSLKPREGRASWRDLGSLLFARPEILNGSGLKATRPGIIEQYYEMVKQRFWKEEPYLRIEIFGLATNQASANGWQHDSFVIDQRIAQSEQKSAWIQDALAVAEETNKALRKSLHRLPPEHGKKRANQKWFLAELIDQAETQFFTAIRRHFFENMLPLVAEADADKYTWRVDLNKAWGAVLQKEARSVFDRIVDGIGTGARTLERRVTAERILNFSLKKLFEGGEA